MLELSVLDINDVLTLLLITSVKLIYRSNEIIELGLFFVQRIVELEISDILISHVSNLVIIL